MLYANCEDRGIILADIVLIRLLRSAFKEWELVTLSRRYSRQRQVVAAETALVILEAKKCVSAWKLKVELKVRCQKCTLFVPRSM